MEQERKTLWVCKHCLMAIESREGNQTTIKHNIDDIEYLEDENESKCDWCEETGFTELYELI